MIVKRLLSQLFSRKKKSSSLSSTDEELLSRINDIIGTEIHSISIYRQVFSLKTSKRKLSKSHERLEFLGDAIFGSIISSYLYKNYPSGDEGYLTQMKSKIVSRENLNELGQELKLIDLVQTDTMGNFSTHINGNLFEALIGAIYLDFGYSRCEKIVLNQFLSSEKIHRLENKVASYKSLVLEWSQKNKHPLLVITKDEIHPTENNFFKCIITSNKKNIAQASETSKKKAEEKAFKRAFYKLNTKYKILEKI